jgi:hypothetical protein
MFELEWMETELLCGVGPAAAHDRAEDVAVVHVDAAVGGRNVPYTVAPEVMTMRRRRRSCSTGCCRR